MNLGVVTVNIPRIALESHGDKDRFWKIFDERMAVAHQALQFRIMRCKQATPVNAPTCSASAHSAVSAPTTALISCSATNAHRVPRLHRPV